MFVKPRDGEVRNISLRHLVLGYVDNPGIFRNNQIIEFLDFW